MSGLLDQLLRQGDAAAAMTAPTPQTTPANDDPLLGQLKSDHALAAAAAPMLLPAPDKIGQANALSRATGAPPSIVDANLPQFQSSVDAQQRTAIIAGHPALAKFAADPRNAQLSSDDMANMALAEKLAMVAPKPQSASPRPTGWWSGFKQTVGTIFEANPEKTKYFNEPRNPLSLAADAIGSLFGYKPGDIQNAAGSGVASSLGSAVGGVGDLAAALERTGYGNSPLADWLKKNLTVPVFSALSKDAATLDARVSTYGTLANAAKMGGSLLPYLATAELSPLVMGAQGANTQQQAAEKKGVAGGPEADTAVMANAAFQAFLGKFIGGDTFSDALPGTISNVLTRTLARGAGAASTGAIMQGGSNLLTQELIDPKQSLTEGVTDSAVQMAALDFIFHAVPGVTSIIGNRLTRAADGAADAHILDGMNAVAEASKVRERDPVAWQSYLQQVGDEHGMPESVYVNKDAFAKFVGTPEGQAIVSQMPETIRDAMEVAFKAGSDVKIPTPEFGTYIAGSKAYEGLADNIKFDPNSYTRAEAKQVLEEEGPRVLEEMNRILTNRQSGDALAASRAAVESQIKDQLDQAGRYSSQVNAINAKLGAASIAAHAERVGMTPEEFYQKHGFKIVNEQTASQSLESPSRGTFSPDVNTIALLKNADLSTFIHELGHWHLETLSNFANAGPALGEDFGAVAKWLGTTPEKWSKMGLEERRPFHEKFAQGFEKYLLEGKAPSETLRGVFRRAAAWLKQTYLDMRGLNVGLSPEVRQVMDRLVATQDEIRANEAQQGYSPAFATKPDAMSDEQWASYQALGREATAQAEEALQSRSLRDLQWLENAKSRELKRLQDQHDTARKAVRDEAAAEVMSQPANRAREFVRFGRLDGEGVEGPHKLNIDQVRAMYQVAGEEFFNRLGYGKYGMLGRENSVHPEQVADQFGYASAREMIDDMLKSPRAKDAISALTDQRMLERYGDTFTPEQMQRAAMEAIHNEARGRALSAEYAALAGATGRKGVIEPAAREMAKEIIGNISVGELKNDRFHADERRAGERAADALRRNDLETAAAEKRTQVLNFHLAREAGEAAREMDSALDLFRRAQKSSSAKAQGNEAHAQIVNLLSRYDLAQSTTGKEIEARKTLAEWLSDQRDSGFAPAVSDDLIASLNRKPWRELSVDEARALRDAVKSIDHIGRQDNKIASQQRKIDLDQAVEEFRSQTAGMKRLKVPDARNPNIGGKGLERVEAKWLKLKSFLRYTDSSLLKIEQIGDWLDQKNPNGVFNRLVFRNLADGQGVENRLLVDLSRQMAALYDAMPKEEKSQLAERFTIPELIDTRTGKASILAKSQLLSLALNAANESNFGKLLKAEKWDRQAVVDVLDRHLSNADIGFVNGVIRMTESLWPQIKAMEERLSGIAPEKIEGRPLDLANGRIEGGYFPVVYDPSRSPAARAEEQLDAAKTVGKMFDQRQYAASTFHGHTVERSGYNAPILLDLNVIPRHLREVVHDLAYREAVMNADKFLRDGRVRNEISEVMGPEYYDQFRPWLKAIATDRLYDGRGQTFIDKIAHWGRTSTTMLGLGYRASTMLVHGTTAASNSVAEIGPVWFAKGMDATFGSPAKMRAAYEFVTERSPEMFNRMDNVDRDIREQVAEMEARSAQGRAAPALAAVDAARRYAFFGVGALDMASAVPTWMGAYLKAMEKPESGGLGLSEGDAVYYADKAVRNAHGGSGIKDLAAVQRGNEVQKLFTMFYSFWNHIYNRQRDLGRDIANVKSGHDFTNVLMRSWFYLVIPQLLHGLLKTPSQNDEQNDGTLGAWLKWSGEEVGLGLTSGIPVMRDIANSVITGRDYEATPAARVATDLAKVAKDAAKTVHGEPVKAPVKDIANASSIVFHVPLGQAGQTGQFLWDVMDGDQRPDDLGDWWNGVIYGKTKQ